MRSSKYKNRILITITEEYTVREFMQKHSYNAVRLFIDQIAISIFGLVLAIACGRVENDTLKIITSVGAIVFYLFLIYAAMWEVGSKDKFGIDNGTKQSRPLTGLFVALLANSFNLLLALIILGCSFASEGSALSTLGALAKVIALFIEGMYTGLLSLDIDGVALNNHWLSYFVITVPALVTSALAYWCGTKGYHFSKILIPENPEEAEIKREKKMARKKQK